MYFPLCRGPQNLVQGSVAVCGPLGTRPRKRQASTQVHKASFVQVLTLGQNHPLPLAATTSLQGRKGWGLLLYWILPPCSLDVLDYIPHNSSLQTVGIGSTDLKSTKLEKDVLSTHQSFPTRFSSKFTA